MHCFLNVYFESVLIDSFVNEGDHTYKYFTDIQWQIPMHLFIFILNYSFVFITY